MNTDICCFDFGMVNALKGRCVDLIEAMEMAAVQTTQTTLKNTAVFSGKGLHCGRIVTLKVLPAPANHGIVFRRTDHSDAVSVAALASEISSTTLSTTIGEGHSSVSTIEHLMAALAGLGISNAMVELDGPEVPIMDGSAKEFVRGLLSAGQKDLALASTYYRVRESFEIKNGDQFIRIDPSDSLTINCSIDFPHRMIGQQSIGYVASLEAFLKIARSRTFCHVRDVNAMRERGLALGGSLENAIVLSDEGLLNKEGLYSQEEFVEHKLLDLIGDVALMGHPLIGSITAHKPGHTRHAEFTKALLEMKGELLVEESTVLPMPSSATIPFFTPTWAHLG